MIQNKGAAISLSSILLYLVKIPMEKVTVRLHNSLDNTHILSAFGTVSTNKVRASKQAYDISYIHGCDIKPQRQNHICIYLKLLGNTTTDAIDQNVLVC